MKCIRHNVLWFLSGFLLIVSAGSATAATYVVGPVSASGDRYMIKGDSGSLPLDVSTTVGVMLVGGEDAPLTIPMEIRISKSSTSEIIYSTQVESAKRVDPSELNGFDYEYGINAPNLPVACSDIISGSYEVTVSSVGAPRPGYSRSTTVNYTVLSGRIEFGGGEDTVLTAADFPGDEVSTFPDSLSFTWRGGSYSAGGLEVSTSDVSPADTELSVDLIVDGGTASIGDYSGEHSGIEYVLKNVSLSNAGFSYNGASISLPEGVTAHTALNGRVLPNGKSIIETTNSGTDFSTIVLSPSSGGFLHSYGLPFFVLYNELRLDFNLNAGIEILTSPGVMGIHRMSIMQALIPENIDERKNTGFASNDIMFYIGTAANVILTDSGINGDFVFHSKSDSEIQDMAAQTHFPKGEISWDAFDVTVVNGEIQPLTVSNFSWTSDFSGKCPDGECGDAGEATSFNVGNIDIGLAADGAFGGKFTDIGNSTNWGKVVSGTFTYEKDDTAKEGMIYFPGFVVPGTEASESAEEAYSLSQYLLGSREFSAPLVLSDVHYLNDTADENAKQGNFNFAGLNMGPQQLEPFNQGDTDLLSSTDLNIQLNGQTSQKPFTLTDYSKYVVRPGGVTGVFNTTLADDTLALYGYTLNLKRFAFRQVMNRMDDETFIDGSLDLPFPAKLVVEFSSLDITCTGDLTGGTIENGDTGKVLKYWKTPTKLMGMEFADTTGNPVCSDASNIQLRLDTSNQINGLSKRATLSAFWSPAGQPSDDKITSAVDVKMDTPSDGEKEGFTLFLRDGFINHPADYPTEADFDAKTASAGFTNLFASVDVPLFDDVEISGHFANGDTDENDFTLHLFRNMGDDSDKNGIPDSASWTMDEYRGFLTDDSETLTNDPRPHALYSWSGLVNLDYPLHYTRAKSDTPPQFTGVKQTAKLPGEDNPVITVTSTPDYMRPDRTKLSFGATADVAELKNFHVDLTCLTGDLDSFLADRLNVGLPIENLLQDVVDSTNLMHSATGGDITGILDSALDQALAVEVVDNGFDALSGILQKVHNAPKQVTGQITNRLNNLRNNVLGNLESGLRANLTTLIDPADDIAALLVYNADSLQTHPSITIPAGLVARKQALSARIASLTSLLQRVRGELGDARAAVEDVRTRVNSAASEISTVTGNVKNALDTLNNYTSASIDVNPLLTKLKTAKDHINTAKDSIKNLDIGQIADALQEAAQLSGSSIDTSMLNDADRVFDERIAELERLMAEAETNFTSMINSAGLGTIFSDAKSRIEMVETHVNSLKGSIDSVFVAVLDSTDNGTTSDGGYVGVVESGLDSVLGVLNGLDDALNGDLLDEDLSASPLTLADIRAQGQVKLNTLARGIITDLAMEEGSIGNVALQIKNNLQADSEFKSVFVDGLMSIIEAPIDQAIGGFIAQIESSVAQATQFIPDASSDDLKEMVKGAIMNSAPVQNLNDSFYQQFGFVSNYVDDLSGELTKQVNNMINETVEAVSAGLNAQLSNVTSGVGGAGPDGLKGAKMDGYAIVSQDELERVHIEAEFEFKGKPKPTKYYAGLDITNWNAENGKGGACAPLPGVSLFDVVISTKDIKGKMLGSDIGIKTASLGFTFNELDPLGIFGNVYTSGELKFESMKLKDMGLEAALGDIENYLGAKATGVFDDYDITAAFFYGLTCDYNVIKRLDKDVADFIGEHTLFEGVYLRGGGSVPIYDNGCALKVGVGAEIGAWYLARPVPVYGGLLGGSAFGRVACLASLKGKVTLAGTKTGDQYRFHGEGWGAGGVGSCEQGKWGSVSRSRKDTWCRTGDATFEATYSNGWSITAPDIHCCY